MNIGLVAIGVVARLLLPSAITKAGSDTATVNFFKHNLFFKTHS